MLRAARPRDAKLLRSKARQALSLSLAVFVVVVHQRLRWEAGVFSFFEGAVVDDNSSLTRSCQRVARNVAASFSR